MHTLINDLLAYSRVGTHGKPFELTDCDAVLYRLPSILKVAIEESGAVATHDKLPTIRGNGIGIEPKYAEKIFVTFQRLQTRSEYPGTGMGLSICKRIVERHGGRIWVVSELRKGTTFCFTIPYTELERNRHLP